MKLKKSDINLLIAFLGIVIAVCSYLFIFTKCNEMKEEQEAKNAVLQDEVNRLQDLADHQQEYIDETNSMNSEMDEIKAQFAASYKPEDEILYVDSIEKAFKADVATISMPGSNVIEIPYTPAENTVNETSADVPASDDLEEGEIDAASESSSSAEPPVMLYKTPVTISYVASYDALKELLQTMNQDNMRKSIESVSMAFDGETGDITGGIAFSMYSMTGTDATYEIPSVPGVTFGTNNIFNSASKKAAIQSAE